MEHEYNLLRIFCCLQSEKYLAVEGFLRTPPPPPSNLQIAVVFFELLPREGFDWPVESSTECVVDKLSKADKRLIFRPNKISERTAYFWTCFLALPVVRTVAAETIFNIKRNLSART